MLSLAMACNRRGAPVRLCRPAPQVEKKDPMTMTQGEGQANVPTTRFLLTPSPYLQGPGLGRATCKEPPRPWVRPPESGMSGVRKDGYGGQSSRPSAPKSSPPAPILSPCPSPILMSPFSKRQKSRRGLTHPVAHTTTGNQQPEDTCGTTCPRGAGVRVGRSWAPATGKGPAHSLVPEYHTLDAGAKENHTAEVCSHVKESRASTATAAPTPRPHRTHVPLALALARTQLGHLQLRVLRCAHT